MSDRRLSQIHLLQVEDNPGDARLVQILLSEVGGFAIDSVGSLKRAQACLAETHYDAVLLDLSLPDSTGLETVAAIRRAAPDLPVVVFTGLDDEATGLDAVQQGCEEYLVKGQGDGAQIRRTIRYAIERKAAAADRDRAAQRIKRVLVQTVKAVSLTLELRDPYTAGHQRRVARLATAIGARLGMPEQALEGLQTAALIHDIGKINVPLDFLSRPGKLSDAAFEIIMAHPQVGHDIVADIEFPWPVATMILQHHERLDGSGYPHGTRGDAVVGEARILAVADVVEAISSHRPYRPSLGLDAALTEIESHAGSKYDPAVVAACQAVLKDGSALLADDDSRPPGY